MLIHEEMQILFYLQHNSTCSVQQIQKGCLPGASDGMAERILGNLQWLGYITFFPGSSGQAAVVQITTRGREAL